MTEDFNNVAGGLCVVIYFRESTYPNVFEFLLKLRIILDVSDF